MLGTAGESRGTGATVEIAPRQGEGKTVIKLAMFAFACFASAIVMTGGALATEPVEAMVTGWVAAIDDAPGWTATYGDLIYDPATDTALLSGLEIESVPGGIVIAFEPISIVGYAEQIDGTFSATSVTTNSANITANTAEITASDIRLDNLGILTNDANGRFPSDPQHPFTSLMRIYALVTSISLKHGGIGSISINSMARGETALTTYKGISVDDWAEGKVASMTAGTVTIESETPDGPIKVSIGGAEARDMDFAAIMRVLDPSQYAEGVGDGIWHSALGFAGYNDLAVDGPDAKVTIASISAENFMVRQPVRSIAGYFDKIMLDPDAGEDLTPEEMRDIVGFLSAFSIGRLAVRGIDVDAEDGGQGHLGGMTFSDFSAEGLGEFSLDDIDANAEDAGFAKIGRIAVGDIVFPDLERVIDATEAWEAGEELDYGSLAFELGAFKLGFIEVLGIDVETPEVPHYQLGKFRLDLANYVGPIPTLITLKIAGLDVPAMVTPDAAM